MTLPVVVLALLTVVGGLVDIPGLIDAFSSWIDPVAEPLVHPSTLQDYGTSVIAVIAGALGGFVAWIAFRGGREIVGRPALRRVLTDKLYFDELYEAVFSRPNRALAAATRDRVETPIVQGSLDGVAHGTTETAGDVARVQTGLLRTYALTITASVVVLAIVFLVLR